jgi:type II restriction/modification system DNA methylase subunit YeeA
MRRCIVTPEVNKHRIFVWMDTEVIPDHKVHIIARADDYFMGVLQSEIHEKWTLATCSWIGKGNDPSYNSETTFLTFPFPYPPGTEPSEAESPIVRAIAEAARELVRLRDSWLNPPNASEADLKSRTLTKLYNERPTWLDNAHRALDQAVFAAYGWPYPLPTQQVLANLLALNHQRAAAQAAQTTPPTPRRPGRRAQT